MDLVRQRKLTHQFITENEDSDDEPAVAPQVDEIFKSESASDSSYNKEK